MFVNNDMNCPDALIVPLGNSSKMESEAQGKAQFCKTTPDRSFLLSNMSRTGMWSALEIEDQSPTCCSLYEPVKK